MCPLNSLALSIGGGGESGLNLTSTAFFIGLFPTVSICSHHWRKFIFISLIAFLINCSLEKFTKQHRNAPEKIKKKSYRGLDGIKIVNDDIKQY